MIKETPLQSYLRHWKDPAKLTEEFGIKVYEHPTLPLLGFKYDQIESPKIHEIVRWSRGTVLEKDTFNLVAQPLKRFYNYGEYWPEMDVFNWKDFTCYEKLDGSLQILYYYNGEWHVNTSGSFGLGEINNYTNKTWREVFWEAIDNNNKLAQHIKDHLHPTDINYGRSPIIFDKNMLNTKFTYIFELCSQYNQVVQLYHKPEVHLLGVFNIEYDPYEFDSNYVDHIANDLGLKRPEKYQFNALKEIEQFIQDKEETEPDYEGVVIRDNQGIRFKIKSKTYLSLAHIKDNGNIYNPKRLVPWVLTNNTDELLCYYPDLKDTLAEVQTKINTEWNNLLETWEKNWMINDQKTFALAIKDKTKFTGILFTLRKQLGSFQTKQDLSNMWRESQESIIKILFNG